MSLLSPYYHCTITVLSLYYVEAGVTFCRCYFGFFSSFSVRPCPALPCPLSVCLSLCSHICISISLSISMSISLSISLFISLSIYLSLSISRSLSLCPLCLCRSLVYLFVPHLFVYLSASDSVCICVLTALFFAVPTDL